jgi:hypothetical protein
MRLMTNRAIATFPSLERTLLGVRHENGSVEPRRNQADNIASGLAGDEHIGSLHFRATGQHGRE